MVLHKDRQVIRAASTRFTTLCGRMNAASVDGMNVADTDAGVTCKFCLRQMEITRRLKATADKRAELSSR